MMSRRLLLTSSRTYVSWTSSAQRKKHVDSLLVKILGDYNNYVLKIVDKSLANAYFIDSTEMKDRIKKLTEYYIIGRKPVQGEIMAHTYISIVKPINLSDELLHKMQIVVSTTEMVQSYYFLSDDYEDGSTTRLGKPCWHLLDNNGTLAFSDACILRSFINEIVRQNFEGRLRDQILGIYNKLYFIASIGQYMDIIGVRSKNYDKFSMQHYNYLNKYKSAFYAIKSPMLLALALSNKLNKETFDIVDNIGDDIGILVQIHNDLIDYFLAKGTVSGKSGTDIQEGKCSWPAVAVLQKCSPEQRRIFTENYGSKEPEKVERILRLYEEFNIQQLYAQEEKARYDIFHKKVSELPKDAIPSAEFFKDFYSVIRQYTEDTKTLMYVKF